MYDDDSARRLRLASGIFLAAATSAAAHVTLHSPNGGEVFTAGSTVTIEWEVAVGHDHENWDLWYSTDSASGPWTEIAIDLPPGDTSTGSMHTYDWLVPGAPDDSVWIRIQQDNPGEDYDDVSDQSFSIVAPNCAADLTTQGANAGEPGYGIPDGVVSNADIQFYVNAWIAQDLSIADLTTTNAPVGDPDHGVPDGSVTTADIQFYVNLFVVGCP